MMAGLSMGFEAWLWMGAWALVLIVTVWLLVREPRHSASRDRALDTLRARFARGEISRDEFDAACRLLEPRTDHSEGAR